MKQTEFDAFGDLLNVVADYYGRPLKDGAIMLWWNAMTPYDLETMKRLLNQHVATHKFMPTIAELLDTLRTMDGRPNAEEAWASLARCLNDEGITVVWTEEMAQAFGVALGLQDDHVAARMAFKESYEQSVREARKRGFPVKWTTSLGHDPAGREGPLLAAVRDGKLTGEHVAGLLPYRAEPSPEVAALLADKTKLITEGATAPMPPHVRAALDKFKSKITNDPIGN